jgi:hypothetical protein
MLTPSFETRTRGHRVRELVCAYRPLRDHEGRVVSVATLALSDPRDGGCHARALTWQRTRRSVRRRLSLDEASPSRMAPALAWDTREHTRFDS